MGRELGGLDCRDTGVGQINIMGRLNIMHGSLKTAYIRVRRRISEGVLAISGEI